MWRRWGTPENFVLFIDELWKTLKNYNFVKMKNKKKSSFYTCVPKTTIKYSSWGKEWENFFCHFGPFFAFYTPLAPNTPENQHFEKMKKAPRDIVLLDYVHHK